MELKQLHERAHATTVYVTHDQTEAMTMASRIVVMRAGVIQQIGAPLEIYNRPRNRFVAEFVGSPPMNFIPCGLVREGGGVYAVGPGLRLGLPDAAGLDPASTGEILLGIRPEDIALEDAIEANAEHGVLTAEIIAVEPLGNATYVSLRVDRQILTAVTSPRMQRRVHEVTGIRFNLANLHLFAADATGAALRA